MVFLIGYSWFMVVFEHEATKMGYWDDQSYS